MEKSDVELIRSILSGDDAAFSDLVQKYQKSVHALAWRKVGDFQVAEEITQDAFLKAYKKLATLKNPNQFAGWLYVIASNLCSDWHRRKKPTMQSLEATKTKTLEKTAYERYVAEEREKAAAERRRELVKNLLEKLPESERTVVTLHYLGEMTSEAISKFMGVSVNTIRSRLRRARKRLEKEEPMIRETLGSIQLPANLTENIMEQIADIKPSPASSGKPLVPWAALGSAVVLVILLLGASNQLLTRFQKPYSLEAQSETAIEIVDTSIILDVQSKPETRRQIGSAVLASQNNGSGQQVSEDTLAADTQEDSAKVPIPTHQWTQAIGPQSGNVHEIFLTSGGKLLTVSPTGIYQMTEDATEWGQINNTLPTQAYSKMPMAEHEDTLYIVSNREIFASTNGGVNWNSVGSRPRGTAIELLITDEASYLVMDDEIFRSTDAGKQWELFNNGLKDREITAAAAIGNTVFVGTNRGLYRLNSGIWKQLPVGKFRTIDSLAISGNTVYVGMTPNDSQLTSSELKTKFVREMMRNENSNSWEIFRSDDLGYSWSKITPQNRPVIERVPTGFKVLVSGKTILALGTYTYRSRDGGQTWDHLGVSLNKFTMSDSPIVAQDENTFYKEGLYKLQRTIDAGESWHPFMKGIVGSKLDFLVSFGDRLYAYSGKEIVQSSDGGDTWTTVFDESGNAEYLLYPRMTVANNTFYAIARDAKERMRICSLSSNGNLLVPVQRVPAISGDTSPDNFSKKDIKESGKTNGTNYGEKLDGLEEQIRNMRAMLDIGKVGGIAVSNETFYVEYTRRIFKWKHGFPKWIDTGFDIGENCNSTASLAASGKMVYVGRRDGALFQSHDEGKNWKDITSNLPLEFDRFNEIVFVGSTVYVATDNGVLTSESAKHWRVLTDSSGSNIVIASLAVDSNTVYGVGDVGIYELDDHREWAKISPEVPDQVQKLVIHNDKFYIMTENRGIFHIPLEVNR